MRNSRFLIVVVLSLVAVPAFSRTQGDAAGPSFPCEKAKTRTEKLICSDRNLAALDLEYSQLYAQRLKDSADEVPQIKSDARFFLPYRDRCANGSSDPNVTPSSIIECVESWYFWRIAELRMAVAASGGVDATMDW